MQSCREINRKWDPNGKLSLCQSFDERHLEDLGFASDESLMSNILSSVSKIAAYAVLLQLR